MPVEEGADWHPSVDGALIVEGEAFLGSGPALLSLSVVSSPSLIKARHEPWKGDKTAQLASHPTPALSISS